VIYTGPTLVRSPKVGLRSDQLTDDRRFRIRRVVDGCVPRVPGAGDRYLALRRLIGSPRTGPADDRARQADATMAANGLITRASTDMYRRRCLAPHERAANPVAREEFGSD
jgi:hypothetical protein